MKQIGKQVADLIDDIVTPQSNSTGNASNTLLSLFGPLTLGDNESTSTTTTTTTTVVATTTVYECMRREGISGAVGGTYHVNRLEPQATRFDFIQLLRLLDRQVSKSETATLVAYGRTLSDQKQRIVSHGTGPADTNLVIHTLQYLVHLTQMLPLMSGLATPFAFRVQRQQSDEGRDDDTVPRSLVRIEEHSLQFEYLMTLWFLVSRLYSDCDGVSRQTADRIGAETPTEFHNRIGGLSLCIDIARHTLDFVAASSEVNDPPRLVYVKSPQSISNAYRPERISPATMERNQQERDAALIAHYFGGRGGIEGRLALLSAKKYEFYFVRIQNSIGLLTPLDHTMHGLTRDNPQRTLDVCDLASLAWQIGTHYANARRACSDQAGCASVACLAYLRYRRIYWKALALMLRASVDYYLYGTGGDADLDRWALARLEEARKLVTDFTSQTTVVYSTVVVEQMQTLRQGVEALYYVVYQDTTTLRFRVSKGVVPSKMTPLIPEKQDTTLFMQTLTRARSEMSVDDTAIMEAAYSVLQSKQRQNTNNTSDNELDDYSEEGGGGGYGYELEDVDEARLQLAVYYERQRWIDYLLKNVRTDRKGNRLIVIKDLSRVMQSRDELDRIQAESVTELELLLPHTQAASSVISNRLLTRQTSAATETTATL